MSIHGGWKPESIPEPVPSRLEIYHENMHHYPSRQFRRPFLTLLGYQVLSLGLCGCTVATVAGMVRQDSFIQGLSVLPTGTWVGVGIASVLGWVEENLQNSSLLPDHARSVQGNLPLSGGFTPSVALFLTQSVSPAIQLPPTGSE